MDTGQHWALCWVTLGNCVWQTKWQRAASRADHSKFAQNSCDDNKSRAGTVSSSLNHFHTRSPGWAGSVWGEMITTAQTQLCRAKTHSRDIVIRAQYTLWSRLPMYLHYTHIYLHRKYKLRRWSSVVKNVRFWISFRFEQLLLSRLGAAVSPEEIPLP